MPVKDEKARATGRIEPEVYERARVKMLQDKWSVDGLIREAFALYLAGEIIKPEEAANDASV